MPIWGKLAGAAAGLALGGPLGALMGGVAGHVLDRWRKEGMPLGIGWKSPGDIEPPPVLTDPRETRRIAYATAIIVLAAKLAKVDGAVSRDEIRAFRELFDVRDEDVGGIAAIFDHAKQTPEGFEPYARQIAQLFGYDPVVLAELLDGLLALAVADGMLHPAERAFLQKVGMLFGFDPRVVPAWVDRFGGSWERQAPQAPTKPDDYALLGLTASASADELKQAYRRLVREHHPDRLVAQGVPEQLIRAANQRLGAINAAYDRIARERGIR